MSLKIGDEVKTSKRKIEIKEDETFEKIDKSKAPLPKSTKKPKHSPPVLHLNELVERYNESEMKSEDTWIFRECWSKLKECHHHCKNDMFSDVVKGKLQAPLCVRSDKRKASWVKSLGNIARQINPRPKNVNQCWLVQRGNDTSGYHQWKFQQKSKSEGKAEQKVETKWRTHMVMTVIWFPEHYDLIQDKNRSSVFAHRCGNGRMGSQVCINPYHIAVCNQKMNESHKGCKYGCRQLCPHNPKCIWNWRDTGEPKQCLNLDTLPAVCNCTRQCFPSVI